MVSNRWRPIGVRLGGMACVLACTFSLFGQTPASAETLAEALASAYMNNPTLDAERARQRATDEQVPQALSGWRPTVVANGDAGVEYNNTNTAKSAGTEPAGLSIELNQPLFRGFRTINQTKAAEANVRAGRETLLSVEQQLLFDSASVFVDVIRDREIVRLRRKNVAFLSEQLRASNSRFEVGEITRTDVSQSNARLSLSRSNLAIQVSPISATFSVHPLCRLQLLQRPAPSHLPKHPPPVPR